jgi:DnaJ-class molecular chaperone
LHSDFDTDHYATLGLDRRCTTAQVRAAYRILAKQHHPDTNAGADAAEARQAELNVAYETLSDAAKRRSYDQELTASEPGPSRSAQGSASTAKIKRNISQDVLLRVEDFLLGTRLEVRVADPANPHGQEAYPLIIPPDTAPGERIRLPRGAPFEGGYIIVRTKLRPSAKFKARGSDLRCDLRISAERATRGGQEMIVSATGRPLRVTIPPGLGRGETLRIPREGLPKARGGRGDMLVRVTYRIEATISAPKLW